MALGDFAHDRQTQARAVHVGAQCAVKRLKHQLALSSGDARPVVFHLHRQDMAVGVDQQSDGDHPGPLWRGGGVVHGVVHQIANHLFEQRGVALNFRVKALGLGVYAVVAQVQAFV